MAWIFRHFLRATPERKILNRRVITGHRPNTPLVRSTRTLLGSENHNLPQDQDRTVCVISRIPHVMTRRLVRTRHLPYGIPCPKHHEPVPQAPRLYTIYSCSSSMATP